jgi:hypothetical protein
MNTVTVIATIMMCVPCLAQRALSDEASARQATECTPNADSAEILSSERSTSDGPRDKTSSSFSSDSALSRSRAGLQELIEHLLRYRLSFGVHSRNSVTMELVNDGEYVRFDELEAALTAHGPQEAQGWQPIATAPHYQRVLIYDDERQRVMVAEKLSMGTYQPWFSEDGLSPREPTHWMPLPAAPTDPSPSPAHGGTAPQPEIIPSSEQKLLNVIVRGRDEEGPRQADTAIAAMKRGEWQFLHASEMCFHQIRLRVLEDPTILKNLACFAEMDGKFIPFDITDNAGWPPGFLHDGWEKECEIVALMDAQREAGQAPASRPQPDKEK